MTTRYAGGEDATAHRLIRYLVDNYAGVDQARADQLIGAHAELVRTGIMMCSHAAYVGDQIADAEQLVWIEEDENDDDH